MSPFNSQVFLNSKKSRLFCPLDRNQTMTKLFFSLVDYRNNYFTSDEPDKIIEFYNGFENREQLIQWMRERPKGVANIHEVDGDKDIIVVIPTSDFNGKYAKECRENIFKGLHIVFVESGGREDFYFNYPPNVNIGIKKAMEYNPKWIVLSGDDMYKVDEPEILVSQLKDIDNKTVGMVYIDPPNAYSGKIEYICEKRKFAIAFEMLINKFRSESIHANTTEFKGRYAILEGAPYLCNNMQCKLFRIYARLSYRRIHKYRDFVSFGIFSSKMIKEIIEKYDSFFDENFVNASDDWDLSIRISMLKYREVPIKFTIGIMIGKTLGTGTERELRNIAGYNLISFKIEEGINLL